MLIKISHLRKVFPRGQKIITAVNNVNLTINQDDFICITGKSGSGKTTLINMIAGLLSPTQGTITFDDINFFSLPDQQKAIFRNQHIGYIPQGDSLLNALNVLDNIRLPFYLSQRDPKSVTVIAQQLLEKANISDLQDAYPKDLSGGEMRRVAILRALICQPQLIIADEPTNDLDAETAADIMDLLKRINKLGTSLLIVSHDNEVASYASRVMKMSAGKLVK